MIVENNYNPITEQKDEMIRALLTTRNYTKKVENDDISRIVLTNGTSIIDIPAYIESCWGNVAYQFTEIFENKEIESIGVTIPHPMTLNDEKCYFKQVFKYKDNYVCISFILGKKEPKPIPNFNIMGDTRFYYVVVDYYDKFNNEFAKITMDDILNNRIKYIKPDNTIFITVAEDPFFFEKEREYMHTLGCKKVEELFGVPLEYNRKEKKPFTSKAKKIIRKITD